MHPGLGVTFVRVIVPGHSNETLYAPGNKACAWHLVCSKAFSLALARSVNVAGSSVPVLTARLVSTWIVHTFVHAAELHGTSDIPMGVEPTEEQNRQQRCVRVTSARILFGLDVEAHFGFLVEVCIPSPCIRHSHAML